MGVGGWPPVAIGGCTYIHKSHLERKKRPGFGIFSHRSSEMQEFGPNSMIPLFFIGN